MPAIMEYYPPGSAERLIAAPTYGDSDIRGQWYDQVRDYYDGKMKHFLDKKEGEPDDNVVINKVKQATDRTVTFLFPKFPELELDPDVSAETPDEEWLEKLWAENGGIALAHDMALVGALSGDVYVRVMPPDNFYEDDYPQILVLDPKNVQTFWKADNLRRVVWHELRWSVTLDNKVEQYLLDFVNKGKEWEIIQYKYGGGVANWEIVETTYWKSALPPVIHWKHLPNPRNYYGTPEYTQSQIALNDKINLIGSENNRINRYHASPKTVATGTSAEEIQETAIDEMWAVENPDAKVFNLEMQSDLASSIAQFKLLSAEFLSESRVVILEGTVKDFQRVTNAGVRTVFLDMLTKNTILRWNYGKGIQMVSRVAAYVAGKGEDIVPVVQFSDPLPVDQTETANVDSLERQMNLVSRQTLSQKRGYNWQSEISKMQLEQNNPVFAPPVATGGPTPGSPNGNGADQKPKSDPVSAASRLKKEPGSVSNQ